MGRISEYKRRLGILINKSPLRPALERCNLVLYHWHDRQHICRHGIGEGSVLVIRPQTETQGLLSSYLYVLKYVRWARENAIIPYVDFEDKKCQYYTGRSVHGCKNAWEYYFEQPSSLKRKSIESARTVLYSGWTWRKSQGPLPIPKRPESSEDQEIIKIVKAVCPVKQYIIDIVDNKYRTLFSGKVLGVFLRGTDYVKLKPKGHARQPDLADVISKIDEFISKYSVDKIFVVTEDSGYYAELKTRYGNKVFSSDDYFVDSLKDGQYVNAAFTNDAYERGLNYLIRILLFGRCDYIISGITNGSVVANLLKTKEPVESYWFDLGLY